MNRLFIYSPLSVLLLLILVILLLPLFVLVFIGVVGESFSKLGLSPYQAIGMLVLSLIGSFINIPVMKRKVIVKEYSPVFRLFGIFEYPRLVVREQVLCINVGGGLIPTGMALYLIPKTPFYPFVITFLLITLACYTLARPIPGLGIVIPAFIPPILSALFALLLSPHSASLVAFCAGVLGTLFGADILNLRKIMKTGPGVVSIGGAGVFDGIFLTGVLAAFLS